MCKKILYVEDDNRIREAFSLYLGKFFDLACAENGKVGLDKFLSNNEEIDLIITDISMPIMDGLEMIENIRQINRNVTIYVTSAFDDSIIMEKAYRLNTNRFIEKPLRINQIIEFISNDFNKIVERKIS